MMHTTEMTAPVLTTAAKLLLEECVTPHEWNAVVRVSLKAGLLWRCHDCKENHYPIVDACSCGTQRPSHMPG
ncbi:hypothetical protein [Streptomyces sp. NPDC058548]|uniref:hypothetical protein n=1 Tax=Streptomyces sp. NPDC058548 TaxID=3346545 RepID=UPI0036470C47